MPVEQLSAPDPAATQSAGRALVARDLARAEDLLRRSPDTPQARLVSARLAVAQAKPEAATAQYEGLAQVVPQSLRPVLAEEHARALAAMGRHDDALTLLDSWIGQTPPLRNPQMLPLIEAKAHTLLAASRFAEAARTYQKASALASGPKARERLLLNAAKAYKSAADLAQCESIASPLALAAATGATMEEARKLLVEIGKPPSWTLTARLDRARLLANRRAFEPAVTALVALAEAKNDIIAQEAKWFLALAQFDRRRHYEEALDALRPFSAGKGPRADEAAFLSARALARLDRDDESIQAFKALSRKLQRKDPQRAAECLYQAGRLEHYLGRYRAAATTLVKAIGPKPTASKLGATDRRDALFLAGLSSLLSSQPRPAADWFEQSTQGSDSKEVVARGQYWAAVATLALRPETGQSALQKICHSDPTSWYGALAAARLESAGRPASECATVPPVASTQPPTPRAPLAELSDTAAFLFEAGFSHEASVALRSAEKQGNVKASGADWIHWYNLLDTPEHAIRRATSSFSWPPETADDLRLAEAAYPRPFADLVRQVEDLHGLPTNLLYAIARKESSFDPGAVSSVGALGLMQMMPATYEKNRKRASLPPLEAGALPTPESSLRAAGYELAELLQKLDGQLPLAIMAYNGGLGAVRRWLERSGDQPMDIFVEQVGFTQTRNYVRRVYQNLARYRLLSGLHPPRLPLVASRIASKEPEAEASAPFETALDNEPGETTSDDSDIVD